MSLLLGLDGEDGIGDRHAGFQLDVENAARGLVRYDFKVVGFTAYHRAEGDQRVKLAGLPHFLQNQRMLQRAGHVDQHHIAAGDAEAVQFGFAGRQQALADVLVETAHDDADPEPLAVIDRIEFVDAAAGSHAMPFQ